MFCFIIVSISYDKFKSVHPVIERDERELTRRNQPDLTSSSESEDGENA